MCSVRQTGHNAEAGLVNTWEIGTWSEHYFVGGPAWKYRNFELCSQIVSQNLDWPFERSVFIPYSYILGTHLSHYARVIV